MRSELRISNGEMAKERAFKTPKAIGIAPKRAWTPVLMSPQASIQADQQLERGFLPPAMSASRCTGGGIP
jgi:hypothetical protein